MQSVLPNIRNLGIGKSSSANKSIRVIGAGGTPDSIATPTKIPKSANPCAVFSLSDRKLHLQRVFKDAIGALKSGVVQFKNGEQNGEKLYVRKKGATNQLVRNAVRLPLPAPSLFYVSLCF